ncbi:hypothetical protein [Gordonia soli]|uniref:Uncharacterized protein n=1 Tax=Gordonia soli NBRC 108243 TaxID=1223545 RepID=M0QPG0_9ACTN|nr:hypothetical protein [Gordonia soli]GAC69322.1 hypothetical protein GS4_23_01190 [Gordonia soli NBRC 108243]
MTDPIRETQALLSEIVRQITAGVESYDSFTFLWTYVGDRLIGDGRFYRAGSVVESRSVAARTMPECRAQFDRLRELEYTPETGALLYFRIAGDRPDRYSFTSKTFQNEPAEGVWLHRPGDYRRELARYPRRIVPEWMASRLRGVDDQTAALSGPREGAPAAVDLFRRREDRPVTLRNRLLLAAMFGALTRALGAGFSVEVDRDVTKVRISSPDTQSLSYTITLVDESRAVLSGRARIPDLEPNQIGTAADHGRRPGVDLFSAAPDWLTIEHLDPAVFDNALEFCVWHDEDSWWSSPAAADQATRAIRIAALELESPSDYAFVVACATVGNSKALTDAEIRKFAVDEASEWVIARNEHTFKPIPVDSYVRVVELAHRFPDNTQRRRPSIDYLSGWEILHHIGVTTGDGPAGLIRDEILAIQHSLVAGNNSVDVAIAANTSTIRWQSPPPRDVADSIIGHLHRLRELHYRADTGTWWYARITATTADFGDPTTPPPPHLQLAPDAYHRDLQHYPRPTPDWLINLWHSQAATLHTPAIGPALPIPPMPPFPIVAGRWAAIANLVYAFALPEERADGSLPIRVTPDGLYCNGREGYDLRLTALPDGRAVLSGIGLPWTSPTPADPTVITTDTPDWLPVTALHPAIDHSALTICWWWTGTHWEHSPTAPQTPPEQLPISWAIDRQITLRTLTQIITSTGRQIPPQQIDHFLTTNETNPQAAQPLLRAIVEGGR